MHRFASTVASLYNKLHCNVLTFDYCGYGASTPLKPSHTTVRRDFNFVMSHALEMQKKGEIGKIWIYGSSLGGALAVEYLANATEEVQKCVDLLVLDNPLFSLQARARSLMPRKLRLLVPLVVPPLWNTKDLIAKVKVDTVFITANNDEVVPSRLGLKIPTSSGLFIYLLIYYLILSYLFIPSIHPFQVPLVSPSS